MPITPPTVSPTQSEVLAALRTFLLGVVAAGTEVIQGQDNRVPEPSADNFVVMTPIRDMRLATNIDTYVESLFTGSIAGATMTITAVDQGAIVVGSVMTGVDVADGTVVTAFGSGSGGVGTYTVSPPQTIASELLSTGVAKITQEVQVTVQLDVHGALSFQHAKAISTLFRDHYGVEVIQGSNPAVSPLSADEPRQMPFVNGEQQYEWRWVVEATLQVNETVTVLSAQPFFATATVNAISVQANYPL